MISSHRLIKTALYNGHRGKRQGGTGEQLAVISNQQELEEHREVAPKAKKKKKKKKLGNTIKAVPDVGFQGSRMKSQKKRQRG